MKKVLITGAGGFIGSFLVEKSLEREYETWAGIRKSTSREFLQNPAIRFIDLPFHSLPDLKEAITRHVNEQGKWDYIVHNLGATKCLNPKDFERINYEYTRNFVQALLETDAVPKKFVLMSSLSADVPDEEQTRYGRSKLLAESFLSEQKDFPYLVFRPTGVYGPREKDYYLMLKTIRKGLDVAAGMTTQQLTFIYVEDLTEAIFLGLESEKTGRIYPISDGHTYTDAEYTQLAKEALGKKRVLRLRIPLPVLKLVSVVAEDISRLMKKASTLNRDKYRIMKRRDWTCSIADLRQDLGFEPTHDLRQGLDKSIAWYRKHNWL